MTEEAGRTETAPERKTLFGKHLSMLLFLQAVIAILLCAAGLPTLTLTTTVGLFSGMWVAIRGLRLWRGKTTASLPAVILTPALLLVLLSNWPESEGVGHFDFYVPMFLAVLLSITACADLTDFWSQNIANSAGREKTREFVMRHGLRLLWYGVLGFIAVYALLVPLFQEWQFQQLPPTDDPLLQVDRLELGQNTLFRFCESVTAIWIFVVGACVGSFLNVVIYRVPLGISVLIKPSHCPGCSQKIHGKDNVPIIGWLKLKGACRNCKTTISSRYPTVELVVGLGVLVLYFVELISGGTNLPGRSPNGYAGVQWILFFTKWDLVNLYLLHCFLVCTVFSWAMIRRDKNLVPISSVALMFAIIAFAICVSPSLQPLSGLAASDSDYSSTNDIWTSAITSGLGIGAAALVAGLAHVLNTDGRNILPSHPPSWLLTGLTLGWQAVAGVLLLCLIWKLLSSAHRATFTSVRQTSKTDNFHLVLPWVLLVHHCVWRDLFVSFVGS